MWTIDTSVWINADSPREPHSAESRRFIDRVTAIGSPVRAPTILIVELSAVIARERNNEAMGRAFADRVSRLPFIEWAPLDFLSAQEAALVAARHRLRAPDALFAFVALRHNCVLVSLDNEHLTRLTGVVTVLTPAQALQRIPDAQ